MPFLFAAATICHLKSHSCRRMLHICNKKMAKRDKTTYWGSAADFWRYSSAVWKACIRLMPSAMRTAKNAGTSSAMKTKNRTVATPHRVVWEHPRWSGFFT